MDLDSIWIKTKTPRFPKVTKNATYDVVVIGGGITGITTAYLLKQAGKKVCLLERGKLFSGDTGRTTAHLTCVTDTRLTELVKTFGKEAAKLTWHGSGFAIDLIEKLATQLELDCNFRRVPGFLHAPLHSHAKELRKETRELIKEADLAQQLGIDAAFLEETPLMNKPGIRFSNQALFHPVKYLSGLAKAVEGNGSAIFENSEAMEFEDKPNRITVNGKKIECEHLVIATHVPLMGKTGLASATLLQTKLYPYSSYVVGAKIPRSQFANTSFWDTADPYNYLRIDRLPQHDYAILGGADHKTGHVTKTIDCYRSLEKLLLEMFPDAKIDTHWSAQVVESPDGLPYIGATAENQYVATAFAGNGMTFGTLSAAMIRDAILKQDNPWQELFAVNRKKLRGAAWEYIKENVDFPFYMIRDRLLGLETSTTSDLKRGQGKVLNIDGKRAACARDQKGNLQIVSAVCTHMGCIVHWNNAEKTWDCPCHGSRFHTDGSVLAGPAETPLEPIKSENAKRIITDGSKKRTAKK